LSFSILLKIMVVYRESFLIYISGSTYRRHEQRLYHMLLSDLSMLNYESLVRRNWISWLVWTN
jgi:hypothetical protein